MKHAIFSMNYLITNNKKLKNSNTKHLKIFNFPKLDKNLKNQKIKK